LLALVIGVMIITSIAFIQPLSQGGVTPTPELATLVSPAAETTQEGMDLTPTVTPTEPPSAEEVGYTDGIILCSSVLVLILLVGTLRETLHRRNQQGG
jgi:hypothetical protein